MEHASCFSGEIIVAISRLALMFAVLVAGLIFVFHPADAQGQKGTKKGKTVVGGHPPQWIWLGDAAQANQTVYFRKEIPLRFRVTGAKLYATCDNRMTIYVNGKEVISSDTWEAPIFREVTDLFLPPVKQGEELARNVIAVKAHNTEGQAGLVLRLVIETPKETHVIVSDATWKASPNGGKGWNEPRFDAAGWAQATAVAKLGAAPWAKITETALSGAAKFKKPTATPIELIKVKKDFKVELLYSVPKDKQGSWVSLCTDDKGRLYTSDQYGKLYRVPPPPLPGGGEGRGEGEAKVEELPVDLGEAQGLLWAHNSLYVVVNRGKQYDSGLWRVRSSQNNDVLDTKEKLRDIQGGGEHGPHAVILSPDGKSLYVCAGNHANPVKLSSSTVPRIWGEDCLVPRLWDASGHAVGRMAPAGCIYRVDPDGKDWQLISMGYRNEYDIAFNRHGELFTFDSDMEWDMNLPWYRPTRVCHAVPGSEFGWRGGTGKMN